MNRIRSRRLLVMVMLFIVSFAMGLLILTSCAGVPEQSEYVPHETTVKTIEVSYGVKRIIDREAGVVCWLIYTDGISCLPISETKLGQ
jgi:hypothetical protein